MTTKARRQELRLRKQIIEQLDRLPAKDLRSVLAVVNAHNWCATASRFANGMAKVLEAELKREDSVPAEYQPRGVK